MDFTVIDYLRTLPPDTVLYSVLLAVVISPWIYSWRARMRRIMIRMSWIAVGVAVGTLL